MTTAVSFKTILAALAILLINFITGANARAQDSTRKETIIYSVFLNKVPDHFKFPLIGCVNIADGSQRNAQIGFINLNEKNLTGTQVGYVNTIGGSCKGTQVGFVNMCKDSFTGAQIGYVNLTTSSVRGTQVGFVNLCKDSFNGAEIGFLNVAGNKAEGVQLSFVNIARDSFNGLQTGFVNIAGRGGKGSQIGFVNISPKTLRGPQIGFINVVDSIDKGVPIGFVSFVRKNGYKAIEVGFSEMYPVNVSFKLGIKPIYTFISASYNPDYKNPFAAGFGLGSIMPITRRFWFNPELSSQTTVERHNQDITTFAAQFGCTLSNRLSVLAGPSFVWSNRDYSNSSAFHRPVYTIYEHSIDKQNNLHAGFRFAVRYSFK